MAFDQYHEPPEELSQETRTFIRMIVSPGEEAEAINWYEQRISVEQDKQAKAICKTPSTRSLNTLVWTLSPCCARNPFGVKP
ncbi:MULTISPECIES: hypothetical protein [unclassified Mucilaginibacter]|uniref:ferritin family protein n=1 Tax=unclassified Mucilaginibacter TaxID=2617802 RepID=UPI002AC9DACB|nr:MULTISPECIES: hypothetical protein [unclassified Mucilaginibacter]MEB0249192.1 hypothetical protein [Mucilaginibacter sp. 5B2]MEB0260824.1 hypothetical protein [Mucilaginibacter sp. 10I4]MEB0279039.1 hypothetical protein [Mucilaginibacter sp. 10B2]MEB0299942.1 hypothetical protein [Mucilaginibacter sp. 5C4]WPX22217.1 hypothetical protein RHM67_13090 [Mucilaginibacter sp. 5C4]